MAAAAVMIVAVLTREEAGELLFFPETRLKSECVSISGLL